VRSLCVSELCKEKLLQFCFKEVTFSSLAFCYVIMLLDCYFIVASCSVSIVAP
jgi:hypothetical protein